MVLPPISVVVDADVVRSTAAIFDQAALVGCLEILHG
jgi:hypothetical protein